MTLSRLFKNKRRRHPVRHQRRRKLQAERLVKRELMAADLNFTGAFAELDVVDVEPVSASVESTDRVSVVAPAATVVSGEVNHRGDTDEFHFEATRGKRYTIETSTGTLRDTTLTLFGPDGRRVAFNDDGGEGLASRISFTARQSGTYRVRVSAYGYWQTGSYDLSIAQNHTTVRFGEHLDAGATDRVAFQAEAGATYVFETRLDSLRDSTLRLFASNGRTQLAFNDDGGQGLASRIRWTAPSTGTYYLDVAGYRSYQSGNYELEVSRMVDATQQGNAVRHWTREVLSGGNPGDHVAIPQPITIPRGGGSQVASPQPITIPRGGGNQVASPTPITIPRGGGNQVASPTPITIPRGGGNQVASPTPITIPRGGGGQVASPQPITIPRGGGPVLWVSAGDSRALDRFFANLDLDDVTPWGPLV